MKNSQKGKKWRRALSMLLVLTLVFSLCSVTTFAQEQGAEAIQDDTQDDANDETNDGENEDTPDEDEEKKEENGEEGGKGENPDDKSDETPDSEPDSEEQNTDDDSKVTEKTVMEEPNTEEKEIKMETDNSISNGDKLTDGKWEYDNGTLTISGTGILPDYSNFEQMPWYDVRANITNLVISEGITAIGQKNFLLNKLKTISLPKSMEEINEKAFGTGGTGGADVNGATVYYPCSMNSELIDNTYGAKSLNWVQLDHPSANQYGYCEECGELINFENNVIKDWNGNDTDVLWSYADGTLTISGSGDLPGTNASSGDDMPWYSLANQITKIVVNDRITSIGQKSFYYLTGVKTIELPSSLTSISKAAFGGDKTATKIVSAEVIIGCGSNVAFDNYGATDLIWTRKSHVKGSDGKCENCSTALSGDNINGDSSFSWDYTDGVLTVEGNGQVPKGSDGSGKDMPWYALSSLVTKLVIKEGITGISSKNFYGITNIETMELPNSISSISSSACNTFSKSVTIICGCNISEKIYENDIFGSSDVTWTRLDHEIDEETATCKNCGTQLSATLGDNITWTLENGVLIIEGEGALPSSDTQTYGSGQDMPWYNMARQVTKLVIGEGITTINTKNFCNMTNLEEIILPNSLEKIMNTAFGSNSKNNNRVKSATVYYKDGFNTKLIPTEPDSETGCYYGAESLEWKQYIAAIGNNVYTAIDEVIEASEENATIELYADTTISGSVTVKKGVTFNLNDYKLNLSGGTYYAIPDKATIIEGYKAFANTDGTYTVAKIIKLKFVSDSDVTVKLNGIATTANDDGYYEAKSGDVVAVTAKDVDDKNFEGWYAGNDDSTVLSHNSTYRFVASKDVTYTAKYVDSSTAVIKEPTIAMTNYSSTTLNSKTALLFEATRSVPEGYTVTEAGMLYATNSKLGITGMASTNLFTKKVNGEKGKDWVIKRMTQQGKCYTSKTSSTTSLKLEGSYTLRVTVASETVIVYAIGYAKVIDSDGNESTIYTDAIATSYSLLSK